MSRIIQHPSKVLELVAAQAEPGSDLTRTAAQQLLRAATITRPVSVGLAATQLGLDTRVIVVRPRPTGPFKVMVNPTFTAADDATQVVGPEACLSVKGGHRTYQVTRPSHGTITWVTTTGEPVEQTVSGFYARVIQHEIDHLDGTTIVERSTARHPQTVAA